MINNYLMALSGRKKGSASADSNCQFHDSCRIDRIGGSTDENKKGLGFMKKSENLSPHFLNN
jgi:hypothetical protein